VATNNSEAIVQDGKLMAEDALFRAKYAKTEMCKTEAMVDNPPLLLVAYNSTEDTPNHDVNVECSAELGLSQPYLIALIPLITDDDALDSFHTALMEIPKQKFEWMFMVVEGYFRQMENLGDSHEAHDYERGEMEEDYKNNPFSDVREAIIIYGVNSDLNTEISIHVPYRYDDAGVPVWDEDDEKWQVRTDVTAEMLATEGGRMTAKMVEGIAFMQLAIKASAIHDLMVRGGELRKKKGDK